MNKPGYCVYFFAHHGIGRSMRKTDDMSKTKKELEAAGDYYNIVCDVDEKKAIKKYENLVKKIKEKNRKKREKKGTQKKLKNKKKRKSRKK